MKNLINGVRKRKTFKREVFIATDLLRSKYNTNEIMKELKTSKSDNKRIMDIIKKVAESE